MASRGKAKNYTNNTKKSNNNTSASQPMLLGLFAIDPDQFRIIALRVVGAGLLPFMLYRTAKWTAGGVGLFSGNEEMIAVGWLIAIIFVFLQWFFNQGFTENRTMVAAGFAAYVISMWTSFVGLAGTTDVNYMIDHAGLMLLYLAIAFFLDILPEIMIMFVLFGRAGLRTGDAFGVLWDMIIPGDQSHLYKKRSFSDMFKKKQPARPAQTNPNPGYSPAVNQQRAQELRNRLNGGD